MSSLLLWIYGSLLACCLSSQAESLKQAFVKSLGCVSNLIFTSGLTKVPQGIIESCHCVCIYTHTHTHTHTQKMWSAVFPRLLTH